MTYQWGQRTGTMHPNCDLQQWPIRTENMNNAPQPWPATMTYQWGWRTIMHPQPWPATMTYQWGQGPEIMHPNCFFSVSFSTCLMRPPIPWVTFCREAGEEEEEEEEEGRSMRRSQRTDIQRLTQFCRQQHSMKKKENNNKSVKETNKQTNSLQTNTVNFMTKWVNL